MNESKVEKYEDKHQNIYSKIGKWFLILGVIFFLITFTISIGDDLGFWETGRSLLWGTIGGILANIGLFFTHQGIIFLIIGHFKRKLAWNEISTQKIYFNIAKWYLILGIISVAIPFAAEFVLWRTDRFPLSGVISGFLIATAIGLFVLAFIFLLIGLLKRKHYS